MNAPEHVEGTVSETMAPATQLEARVRGSVQGVHFRYHTRRQARELGLTGYVENRSDGSVYVLAQGEHGALLALLEWLRSGPSLAEVSGLDVQWSAPTVRQAGFEVRY